MKENNRKQWAKVAAEREEKKERREERPEGIEEWEELTIGIDLGDRVSQFCVLDGEGNKVWEGKVATTPKAFRERFGLIGASRVAIEVGSHSRWASEVLRRCGHEVLVADPRRVPMISGSDRKSDRVDAEMLARLARVDPQLLHPIQHRGQEAQKDLTMIRARQALVETRTKLINCVRGLVKTTGERLAHSSSEAFPGRATAGLPEQLRGALTEMVQVIARTNEAIASYDQQIEELVEKRYPETARLRQVNGVGALTSLTFVLTIEDPHRFAHSRDAGCYFGLQPRRDQSGDSDPQLGITKAGDEYVRQLLVNCAHYILGPHGADCRLRRWGLGLAQQTRERDSGKIRAGQKVKKSKAKKRAITAVARKLAVLLHRLWVSGESYEPFRGVRQEQVLARV
jgi:transposase